MSALMIFYPSYKNQIKRELPAHDGGLYSEYGGAREITAFHARVSAPVGIVLSMWKAPAHPIFLTPSEVHNGRNRGSELSSLLLPAPQQEVGEPEQPWLGA